MITRYNYAKIREYFLEGFTNEEIAIMYDSTPQRVSVATKGLERPERI